MGEVKRCTKCGEEKPLSDFHFKPARNLHEARCKPCYSAGTSRYYRENKEKRLAQGAKWRERNRERHREAQARWREENREYHNAQGRKRHHDNPERSAEHMRQWRARNPERALAADREWREKNPEASRARVRRWYARNSESVILANHKRRTQYEKDAGVTPGQWAAIKEAFGGCCAYCGRKVKRLEVDHVVPVTRGGAHEPENVAPACRSCNASKSDRLLLEWVWSQPARFLT